MVVSVSICTFVWMYICTWNVKSGNGFWAHPMHLHTYCKNYYYNFTEDGPPSCLNLFSKENLITFKCHLSLLLNSSYHGDFFFLMPNENLLPCNFNVPFLVLPSGTILSRFLYNNCSERWRQISCSLQSSPCPVIWEQLLQLSNSRSILHEKFISTIQEPSKVLKGYFLQLYKKNKHRKMLG